MTIQGALILGLFWMKEMLKELGWSKAELGRRLGISSNSVSAWKDRPPRYVLAYLELAVAAKRLQLYL